MSAQVVEGVLGEGRVPAVLKTRMRMRAKTWSGVL